MHLLDVPLDFLPTPANWARWLVRAKDVSGPPQSMKFEQPVALLRIAQKRSSMGPPWPRGRVLGVLT